MTDGLEAAVDGGLPEEIAVGRGTCIVLRGSCSAERRRLRSVRLLIDGQEQPQAGLSPGGNGRRDGYRWWAVGAVSSADGEAHVTLELEARIGARARVRDNLGSVRLIPGWEPGRLDFRAAVKRADGSITGALALRPRVAICTSARGTTGEEWRAWTESLHAQTYENWLCIASEEDASSDRLDELTAITGNSERFVIETAEAGGVYRGIERALMVVPPEVPYFVIADARHPWRAETLDQLLAGLEPGANAVAPTQGGMPANGKGSERDSVAALALGKITVDGPLLFRRELLGYAVPFPPAEHPDSPPHRWVALVARALGGISQAATAAEPAVDELADEFDRLPISISRATVLEARCRQFLLRRDERQLHRISSGGLSLRVARWRARRS